MEPLKTPLFCTEGETEAQRVEVACQGYASNQKEELVPKSGTSDS
jgi:hypothetical protein